MIVIFAYGLIMLAGGLVLGATVLRDLLDRPRRPRRARPRIPLVIVLHRAESKQLEIPSVRRRAIRSALGWERTNQGNSTTGAEGN